MILPILIRVQLLATLTGMPAYTKVKNIIQPTLQQERETTGKFKHSRNIKGAEFQFVFLVVE